jgi:hypothetical protein
VVAARAEKRVTLYTGNDDHIVLDLLLPFTLMRDGAPVTVRIKGGLLGHWSVWTRRAVELLERIHAAVESGTITPELLALDAQVTDCNGAVFDVAHDFAGCIAGCHEVLRRQGLLESIACLTTTVIVTAVLSAPQSRRWVSLASLWRARNQRVAPRAFVKAVLDVERL